NGHRFAWSAPWIIPVLPYELKDLREPEPIVGIHRRSARPRAALWSRSWTRRLPGPSSGFPFIATALRRTSRDPRIVRKVLEHRSIPEFRIAKFRFRNQDRNEFFPNPTLFDFRRVECRTRRSVASTLKSCQT